MNQTTLIIVLTLLAVIVLTVFIYCFFCRKKNVDVDDQFTRANNISNSAIQSVVNLQDNNFSTKNGDFDYREYGDVDKETQLQFIIRHLTDREQDICVTVRVDEEENRVFWQGLPLPSEHFMKNFDFHFARQYP